MWTEEEINVKASVIDGDKKPNFNDLKQLQDTSSIYYAEAMIKPYASVSKGTIVVDGEPDEAWENATEIPLKIDLGTTVSCIMKLLWDEQKLHMYADVKDPVLNKVNSEPHQQDSVEIFIDENNNKSDSYEEDDKQYRVNYENYQTFNGTKCTKENIEFFAKVTADDSGLRLGTLSWYDTTGTGWTSKKLSLQ